ncbi:MAG: hypothetical protein NVSMB49_08730 [Ktedonobacteraceae bacterium]
MEQSVAIVTGAAQEIGRAIALRLAQDGLSVVVADLRQDALVSVVEEIQAHGGCVLRHLCDINR